ncbi:MAG: DUF58 domain-containing protein [Elusimicrobia bacterium]|nr:DUF58 domain-containing protein [Elusimicrobiota bacterium]
MSHSAVFDPRWVGRLGVVFRPRGAAGGPLAGHHASVRRGRAGEFIDRRAYSPGDDVRRIDWNVYARSDRWTVREEREDTNLRATLLLDVSASMGFSADGRVPKIRYAAGVLAALGYVLQRGRDAFGWGFFHETLLSFSPPRAGTDVLARLFNQLEDPPVGKIGRFEESFRVFNTQSAGRGAVVVVSDFLGPLEDVLAGLRMLRAARGDLSALQVLDPVELDLSFRGVRRFQDMETSDSLRGDPSFWPSPIKKRWKTDKRL